MKKKCWIGLIIIIFLSIVFFLSQELVCRDDMRCKEYDLGDICSPDGTCLGIARIQFICSDKLEDLSGGDSKAWLLSETKDEGYKKLLDKKYPNHWFCLLQ